MKAIKIRVEVIGEPYTALKEGITVASATKDHIELYFKNIGKHGVSISVNPKSTYSDLYTLYETSVKLANAEKYEPAKKVIQRLIDMHKTNCKDKNGSEAMISRNQAQWETLENALQQIGQL